MNASLQRQVAQPCLRSCSRIRGSPISHTHSVKPRENRSGCNMVPSGWQNTKSLSVPPAPISSRSATCRARCSRSAATVPLSRVTVRRPFAVFGVPIITVCLMAITLCRMEARPPSRSRSCQRNPNASPRLRPVVASRRYAAQKRLPRVRSRNVRSWSAVQVIDSGRLALGGCSSWAARWRKLHALP